MLAVLSALGGVLASFLPEVLKYINGKADRAHELAILRIQVEREKQGHVEKMQEIDAGAAAAETSAVYSFANPKQGWGETLNATVRPVVTYLLLIGYLYSKWPHVSWTDTDMAIMSAVMGFWFGGRSIKHYLDRGTIFQNPFKK